MKKIKIYGAGGHSRVVMDLAEVLGYTITKIFDDFADHTQPLTGDNRPSLSESKESFLSENEPLIIAIGDNHIRCSLADKVKSPFVKLIHPNAEVSKYAELGDGTVVNAGGIIQAGAKIGRHVIINTGALVDHDSIVGDFAHISPNVALTGHVEVGEGSHIGAGAIIIPKVKIGKWCIVGAGTVVIRDVPDYAVVVGNPGRIIKHIK